MDCGTPWICETQSAYVRNQSTAYWASGGCCSTTVETCPSGTHCEHVGFSSQPCVADDDASVVDAPGTTDADAGIDAEAGDAASKDADADDADVEPDGGG
jgi:hypothetical protein